MRSLARVGLDIPDTPARTPPPSLMRALFACDHQPALSHRLLDHRLVSHMSMFSAVAGHRQRVWHRPASVERVYDELIERGDDLSGWAHARRAAFFLPLTTEDVRAVAAVNRWANDSTGLRPGRQGRVR